MDGSHQVQLPYCQRLDQPGVSSLDLQLDPTQFLRLRTWVQGLLGTHQRTGVYYVDHAARIPLHFLHHSCQVTDLVLHTGFGKCACFCTNAQ